MMKKYLLCLDESGTFNENEIRNPKNKKRKCIVGGILLENFSRSWNDKISNLFDSWRISFPEEIRETLYHAVEMGRKRRAEQYTESMFDDMHEAGIDFVIFEDDIDAYILDSNTTYLNLLSEGIIQLLHKLAEIEGRAIELGVVIGRRANTGGDRSIYSDQELSDSIYMQKINERIAIEKAKSGVSVFNDCKVLIRIESEKEHQPMMLADHVCHFWFTKRSRKYRIRSRDKDISIREKITDYFNTDYIFPFLSSDQDRLIDILLNNGTFADALFEYCQGNLTKRNKEKIIKKFVSVPSVTKQDQLDNLVNYINSIIEVHRNLDLGLNLLKKAVRLTEILKKKGCSVVKFEIDIKLLLLAVYNHSAKLGKMRSLFNETRLLIKQYTTMTSDIEYYIMVQNRYAVYLQDVFEFDESVSVCEDSVQVLSDIQSIISKALDLKGASYKSEQMGKILGTEVQAYTALVEKDKGLLKTGIQKSDLAMKQFSMPFDLERQYQYRAVLEAAGGRHKGAIKWLEKYYGMPWEKYIQKSVFNTFGIMNLLKCADYSSESKDKNTRKEAYYIAKKTYDTIIDRHRLSNEYGYPEICILFYAGRVLISGEREKGKALLEQVVEYSLKNTELVYQIMALRALILVSSAIIEEGSKPRNEIRRFGNIYKALQRSGIEGMALEEVIGLKNEFDVVCG